MSSRKALAVLAVFVFAFVALAPVADVTAEDELEQPISTTVSPDPDGVFFLEGEDDGAEKVGNNFYYDCVIVLIIALLAAGALHVKAHKKN